MECLLIIFNFKKTLRLLKKIYLKGSISLECLPFASYHRNLKKKLYPSKVNFDGNEETQIWSSAKSENEISVEFTKHNKSIQMLSIQTDKGLNKDEFIEAKRERKISSSKLKLFMRETLKMASNPSQMEQHQSCIKGLVKSELGIGFDLKNYDSENLIYIENVQPNSDAASKGFQDGLCSDPIFFIKK